MYSLIIVDDHEYLIEGLRKFINWGELGIEIADVASDGEEGLIKIKKIHPDIVITDIGMPVMDGLEMIKALFNDGIQCKFIILTGHGDFEYAREAIKYGVIEFILKPIMPKEITSIMKRIVSICESERNAKEKEQKMRQRLMESRPVLTEKFMEELFDGTIKSQSEFDNKVDFLNLSLTGSCFRVISVQINSYSRFLSEHSEEEKQFLKFSVAVMICEALYVKKSFLSFKERSASFLLNYATDPDTDEAMLAKLELMVALCQNTHGVSISIGAGAVVNGIAGIKESYVQSQESLKYKVYFEGGRVILYKDILQSHLAVPVLQFYKRSMLEDALKTRSHDNMMECLNLFFSTIRRNPDLRTDNIKMIAIDMMSVVASTLAQMGETLPKTFHSGKPVWEVIEDTETLNELDECLHSMFLHIYESISSKFDQRTAHIVEQVLECIKENYNKDISLQELAKRVYLTPNYLGNIFLKFMGKSYLDYLAEYRMQKAVEFLETGKYLVYEVGEMVGYKDHDYFRRIFKDHMGVTPSLYKR